MAFVAAFAISGCAAGRSGRVAPADYRAEAAAGSGVEKRLREAYRDWHGTRHRLGGTGPRGIDCSAFVQRVFAERFELALPRTTKAQARAGIEIPRRQLRAGDLVFFRPRSYPRHVGIYLSRGQFVHVSAKRGVVISELAGTYWSRSYWTARRVLD